MIGLRQTHLLLVALLLVSLPGAAWAQSAGSAEAHGISAAAVPTTWIPVGTTGTVHLADLAEFVHSEHQLEFTLITTIAASLNPVLEGTVITSDHDAPNRDFYRLDDPGSYELVVEVREVGGDGVLEIRVPYAVVTESSAAYPDTEVSGHEDGFDVSGIDGTAASEYFAPGAGGAAYAISQAAHSEHDVPVEASVGADGTVSMSVIPDAHTHDGTAILELEGPGGAVHLFVFDIEPVDDPPVQSFFGESVDGDAHNPYNIAIGDLLEDRADADAGGVPEQYVYVGAEVPGCQGCSAAVTDGQLSIKRPDGWEGELGVTAAVAPASDRGAVADLTFVLDVVRVDSPPVFASTYLGRAVQTVPFDAAADVHDPDREDAARPVTCTAPAAPLPGGLSFDAESCRLHGTPDAGATPGIYSITTTATTAGAETDAAATGTLTFAVEALNEMFDSVRLSVTGGDAAVAGGPGGGLPDNALEWDGPGFGGTGTLEVERGGSATFLLSADDPDGDPVDHDFDVACPAPAQGLAVECGSGADPVVMRHDGSGEPGSFDLRLGITERSSNNPTGATLLLRVEVVPPEPAPGPEEPAPAPGPEPEPEPPADAGPDPAPADPEPVDQIPDIPGQWISFDVRYFVGDEVDGLDEYGIVMEWANGTSIDPSTYTLEDGIVSMFLPPGADLDAENLRIRITEP